MLSDEQRIEKEHANKRKSCICQYDTLAKEKEVDEHKKETDVFLDQNKDLCCPEVIMKIIKRKKEKKKSQPILIAKKVSFGAQR